MKILKMVYSDSFSSEKEDGAKLLLNFIGPKTENDPKIPHVDTMDLSKVKKITVSGIASGGFSVNFTTTDDVYSLNDTSLHFNPRFGGCGGGRVVMNNKVHGKWKKEMKVPIPFKPKSPFDIVFFFDKHRCEVEVNGTKYCYFDQREPKFECVKYLIIKGDISLRSVQYA